MFVTKGTKIQLVKPMGNILTNVGETFEVCNLVKDGSMIIESKVNKFIFIITLDLLVTYFKVEEEKETPKRTWSEWEYDWFYYFNLSGEEYTVPVKFRDNGKVVELRTNYKNKPNLRVKAICNEKYKDKFDFDKGLNLADARLTIKLLQRELDEIIGRM